MGKTPKHTTAMILYHGSTDIITQPLAKAGRPDLDFGQGFYTTDILEQAQKWADRISRQRHERAVINVYEFDKEKAEREYRYLKFEAYDIQWLDFIAACRTGKPLWKDYDCIEGGIANDRVIDTVEAYIAGTTDASHALEELSKHQPNNQICIISQRLIDDCLKYKETQPC
jgi:elongation factor P hydroxylase